MLITICIHVRTDLAPDEHLPPPCMELTAEGEQGHVCVCKHANSSKIKHPRDPFGILQLHLSSRKCWKIKAGFVAEERASQ